MKEKKKKIIIRKQMKFSASRKGHSAAKVKFAKPIIVMQSSCCAMVSNPKNT